MQVDMPFVDFGREIVRGRDIPKQIAAQTETWNGRADDAHRQNDVPFCRRKLPPGKARQERAGRDHQHKHDEHGHRHVAVRHQRAMHHVPEVDRQCVQTDHQTQARQDGSDRDAAAGRRDGGVHFQGVGASFRTGHGSTSVSGVWTYARACGVPV